MNSYTINFFFYCIKWLGFFLFARFSIGKDEVKRTVYKWMSDGSVMGIGVCLSRCSVCVGVCLYVCVCVFDSFLTPVNDIIGSGKLKLEKSLM